MKIETVLFNDDEIIKVGDIVRFEQLNDKLISGKITDIKWNVINIDCSEKYYSSKLTIELSKLVAIEKVKE